ncbi:MAG: glutathione S-transferase family protein [Hyphomonadaceae bacterium]
MAIILHQFRGSHFNEKARWALLHKGVAHARRSYLPGPHRMAMRRLSGQSQTPVLDLDGVIVAGSTPILEALDARFPERPPLFPKDASARSEAEEIMRRFDAEVGPATRTAAFSVFIHELDYIVRFFAGDKPLATRLSYRAALPLVRGLMARVNGADDAANIAAAKAVCDRALDWLAGEVASKPYLAGDGFSAADLTVAALLSPLAEIDHPDVARPPPPRAYTEMLGRWRAHPALHWVREQYRLHRPAYPGAAI